MLIRVLVGFCQVSKMERQYYHGTMAFSFCMRLHHKLSRLFPWAVTVAISGTTARQDRISSVQAKYKIDQPIDLSKIKAEQMI